MIDRVFLGPQTYLRTPQLSPKRLMNSPPHHSIVGWSETIESGVCDEYIGASGFCWWSNMYEERGRKQPAHNANWMMTCELGRSPLVS